MAEAQNKTRTVTRRSIIAWRILAVFLLLPALILSPEIALAIASLLTAYALYHFSMQAIVLPLRETFQTLQQFRRFLPQSTPARTSIRQLSAEVREVSIAAQAYYEKHRTLSQELELVRRAMGHIQTQHEALLDALGRESRTQYQSVLAYANYLEERILTRHAAPELRYDYDDVCESGFALALVANALQQLNSDIPARAAAFALSEPVKHTLIKLSSALDRRAMKLNSSGVDESVMALADPHLTQLALWMVLLGVVRYAADESTLRLRTLTTRDGREVMLSIIVSELSPGSLSDSERADYFKRQLHADAPHLFADAIRTHASITLANLLLASSSATMGVSPLTACSCEVHLTLPAAPIHK